MAREGALVDGSDPGLELGPEVLRHLGSQVPEAMGEAALTRRAREAGLDRLDDARRTVRDHQQRIAEAACAHVLKEGAHRLRVFLGAGHQVQQDLGTVAVKPPPAPARASGQGGCARRCRPRTGRRCRTPTDRGRRTPGSPPTAARRSPRPPSATATADRSRPGTRPRCRAQRGRAPEAPPPGPPVPGCGPSGSPGSRSGTPPRGRRSAAPHSPPAPPPSSDGPCACRCASPGPQSWCPERWCKRFSAGADGGAMESSSGPRPLAYA